MPAVVPIAVVRALEERAFNAWPALQTCLVDGWLLRFANGYTKRANSLNAWSPSVPVEAVLEHVGALYAARGLPLVVRITPLAGAVADKTLANLGFSAFDETAVMTAPLSGAGTIGPSNSIASLFISARPSEAWLDGYGAANGIVAERTRLHARMLEAIPQPVGFACLSFAGEPVAWGWLLWSAAWRGSSTLRRLPLSAGAVLVGRWSGAARMGEKSWRPISLLASCDRQCGRNRALSSVGL
ncbi:MAG: hypothetical protein R3D67_09140 [Hyphomicrobiaceae bacterium]